MMLMVAAPAVRPMMGMLLNSEAASGTLAVVSTPPHSEEMMDLTRSFLNSTPCALDRAWISSNCTAVRPAKSTSGTGMKPMPMAAYTRLRMMASMSHSEGQPQGAASAVSAVSAASAARASCPSTPSVWASMVFLAIVVASL